MATDPLTPYATMLGFTRYVTHTGPAKASFVGGLRRRHASRSGFNPHGRLIKAIKADIQFRTSGTHIRQVVDTVQPRWRPLYQTLAPGASAYLGSLGDLSHCHLVRTHEALAMLGTLPVKINPQFGICYADGRADAVRLLFDEKPPKEEAVLAMLHLMGRHIDQVLPHGVPVLVDVRHATQHRPDPATKSDDVECWLAGEAAAFAAMWSAVA